MAGAALFDFDGYCPGVDDAPLAQPQLLESLWNHLISPERALSLPANLGSLSGALAERLAAFSMQRLVLARRRLCSVPGPVATLSIHDAESALAG